MSNGSPVNRYALKVREPLTMRDDQLIHRSVMILKAAKDKSDRSLLASVNLARATFTTASALFHGHTSGANGLDDAGRDAIIEHFEQNLERIIMDCPMNILNGKMAFSI